MLDNEVECTVLDPNRKPRLACTIHPILYDSLIEGDRILTIYALEAAHCRKREDIANGLVCPWAMDINDVSKFSYARRISEAL
jgi:hypothetical protein